MQLLKYGRGLILRCGFLIILSIPFSLRGFTQTVSLSFENAALEKVLKELEKQVPQRFVYTRAMMDESKPVSVHLNKVTLDSALQKCFGNQPLVYSKDQRFIILKRISSSPEKQAPAIVLTGRVTDENAQPAQGVTVRSKLSGQSSSSNKNGEFSLPVEPSGDVLYISGAEIQPQEIPLQGQRYIAISVTHRIGSLDETVVIGYGKTTRRMNTGSVGKINQATIAQQPVGNALNALQGRVAGLEITQTSGLPGSSVKVQVRGRNSIAQGSQPLFIIDGVPLAAGNDVLNQLISALGNPGAAPELASGISPLINLNPADIESIEVLKDADATAIYGSRGANGIILITTRKGQSGKLQTNFSVKSGWSRITRSMDFLNTPQYLAMRHEGFAQDNAIPTVATAPDLLLWDTTRYTDFKKLLIGGTALFNDVQTSLSGGNNLTQFLFGMAYHRETTVFPGDKSLQRASANLNLQHRSADSRFTANMSVNYVFTKSNNAVQDLTSSINLPPNTPPLRDADGKLNWQEGGAIFSNPLSYTAADYNTNTDNLITHLQLGYKILPGFSLKVNAGYNLTVAKEESITPIAAQNPTNNPRGISSFANRMLRSWIIEPQMEYSNQFGWGRITALIGGTLQSSSNEQALQQASGFTSDALLRSIDQATTLYGSNGYTQYRYSAAFGRIQYNWQDEYLLSFTGRRDGSSRFGPDNRFAQFGSVGAAWIFSNTFKDELPLLSFGKLRASYGSTGNDQITDYQYLPTWRGTSNPYQGVAGLTPTRLFNPNHRWEVNRKLEAAIELGLFKDRLFISAAYFRNRSGNQLVEYPLPGQTGFISVTENLQALVQNTGVEIELRSTNISTGNFSWQTYGNITIPRNKLVSFPGIAYSSYARNYEVGEPLNLIKRYRYLGVNPSTGLYEFEDVNKDGMFSSKGDYQVLGKLDPDFYGGLGNDFQYKGFSCTVFFEFRHQTGRNYLSDLTSSKMPGLNSNQPVIVLERWQQPGDIAPIQRFAAINAAPVATVATRILSSNAMYSDASFLRLKNIAVSYKLPANWQKKIGCSNARIYALAQNVLTITGYRGADPETQRIYKLPPLKTLVIGVDLTF
ncbi:MAG TPA: SusC/RagA family TonB-linked outer membrane protein [Chitinophagaceae bacterium]|nr:SusC/RagA family TonB-linked outer membrane protein [Chitinophagaceae bacterium]